MKRFSIERLAEQFKFGERCSGATNVKSKHIRYTKQDAEISK
jgi:hypothetical protein